MRWPRCIAHALAFKELEQAFDRFRASLDAHLKKLAFEMRKADPTGLTEAGAAASPEGKQALRRADGGR